jgi:hypothetical protein
MIYKALEAFLLVLCRARKPSTEEWNKMVEKRADANDAMAVYHLGKMYLIGKSAITK